MSVLALEKQKIEAINSSATITTEQIVLELQNFYQIDIFRLLKVFAVSKYGDESNRELTAKEKEIFCLTCSSFYSALEKSFIREYRRRITTKEIKTYIKILNLPEVNLNNRDSATKYRESLKETITRTSDRLTEEELEELNAQLRIATTSVKVFDDRICWSRFKHEFVYLLLNLDSDTQISPPMIMTLLQHQYPLLNRN